MLSNPVSRVVLVFVAALVASTAAVRAQSYDEQVRTILKLYDAGKKDTAYALLEPLKSSARLVPSVLYARAQMTPDDRALPLYAEVIALAPGGDFADDAAYQLVRRSVEKSDSLGAATWLKVLTTNYPRSPLVFAAQRLTRSAFAGQSTSESSPTDTTATTTAAPRTAPSAEKPETDASGLRGYALQVGLFPTREAATQRAAELKQLGVLAVPLPKTINGERNVALVVGPFASIDEANAHKPDISRACDCQAFIVRVE